MIGMFNLRKERGFSLVELMIVVAIIAILAAIAIPAFMRFAMKSKTSEATGNLSAIRTCQEAHRAENDVYLICIENPVTTGTDPTSSPRQWDTTLAAVDFDLTGFAPDGDVRYSYQVGVPSANVFVAIAKGDLDDDDQDATFTLTKGANDYPKPTQAPPGEF